MISSTATQSWELHFRVKVFLLHPWYALVIKKWIRITVGLEMNSQQAVRKWQSGLQLIISCGIVWPSRKEWWLEILLNNKLGKICTKIWRGGKRSSTAGKHFTGELHIWEYLTWFWWECWWDLKNLTSYTGSLCILELLIQETLSYKKYIDVITLSEDPKLHV